jgi:hypothetical protein
MTTLALWFTAVATVFLFITAFFTVLFAKKQIETGDRDHKVDRVLDLHKEFARGPIGAGRERFSALMWRAGEIAFKDDNCGRRHCWKPSWWSIFPQNPGLAQDPAFNERRFLGQYPAKFGIPDPAEGRPLSDLRQVLWCISRINSARKNNLLDDSLLIIALGWEVVWWRRICDRLYGPGIHSSGTLEPLNELADWILKQRDSANGDLDFMKGRDYEPAEDFPPVEMDYDEEEGKLSVEFLDAALSSQIQTVTIGATPEHGGPGGRNGSGGFAPRAFVGVLYTSNN